MGSNGKTRHRPPTQKGGNPAIRLVLPACVLLGIALVNSGAGPIAAAALPQRPNVLLIICDDLNDWVLRPPGHPVPPTPNIDRLRSLGVTFTNAHAVVPVCGPSRKCLFSGLYPQTLNDYGFAPWRQVKALDRCVPLPAHFRAHGYQTYGTGKLLHEGAGGDFYTAYGIGPDYGPWPWQGKGKPRNTPHPAQYEKWKKVLPVPMHRDLNYGPLSNVPRWPADPARKIPGADGWYMENGQPFRYVSDDDRDRMPDEISADWAVNILRQSHDRPFYLAVGFIRPHTPLYAPRQYFDRFALGDISLPPYRKNDLEDCAPLLRNRWQWGFTKFKALLAAGGEHDWKQWVQAYLACTAFVDEQVGKLLRALEDSGQWDRTIIVLTADNGYHIGEKDCIQKWHLWEESTRVPLVVRVPGMAGNGRACDHPVSLIDIYPTLVDLCGLPAHPHRPKGGPPLQGHSLRPFLENPRAGRWSGPAVALMAVKDAGQEPHFSVRSRRYRYTLCSDGQEELYDHRADPHEWFNLACRPEMKPLKARLREQMTALLRATGWPADFHPP